jgi:cytochrome c peroxidase
VARTEQTNLPLVNTGYWDEDGAWTRDLHFDTGWAVIWGAIIDEEASNPLRFIHRVVHARFKGRYEAVFGPLPAELDSAHPDAAAYPDDASPDHDDMTLAAAWTAMSDAAKANVMTIMANSGKAVHAYLRKLVSRNAPFDRYVAGNTGAISASAARGANLFVGKAACADCHEGPRFADGKFHNTGLDQMPDAALGVPDEDRGFVDGYPEALKHPLGSYTKFSDDPMTKRLTRWDDFKDSDRSGAFRTPMLRNVGERGPFMHAGQLETLRDVVKFYNDGGQESGFPGTKSDKMVKLNLTEQEIDDLVAFLETLTGGPIPTELVSEPTD